MNFKKLLTIGAVGFMAQNTFAATTATLQLDAVVAASFDIAIVADGNAADIDVEAGVTDLQVGVATETANAAYKVQVTSLRNGKLRGLTNTGIETTAYSIKYDTVSNSPTTTLQTVKNGAAGTDTSNIQFTIAANAGLAAQTYEDVLTFTISAQ